MKTDVRPACRKADVIASFVLCRSVNGYLIWHTIIVPTFLGLCVVLFASCFALVCCKIKQPKEVSKVHSNTPQLEKSEKIFLYQCVCPERIEQK